MPLEAPVTTMVSLMRRRVPGACALADGVVRRRTTCVSPTVRPGTRLVVRRVDGYPRLADLAVIGDKRTAALVARDGTLEWMCVPHFDGDAIFASLLDVRRGGRFALAPVAGFEARRRYQPDTNVLETTFTTADGEVCVTDALTLAGPVATPYTELVRRVDGVAGAVEMAWHVEPRPHFGREAVEPTRRAALDLFAWDGILLSVQAHGLGAPAPGPGALDGRATVAAGDTAALVMGVFAGQPVGGRPVSTPRSSASRTPWRGGGSGPPTSSTTGRGATR